MRRDLRMVFAVLLVALGIGAIGRHIDAAGPNDVDSLLMKVARPSSRTALPLPFYVTASPDPYPGGAGLVDLVLLVVPKHKCEEVRYEVLTLDNLSVISSDPATFPVVPDDTTFINIQVDIPPSDTSGLVIEFTSNIGHKAKLPIYFVSEAESVEFYLLYRDGFRRSNPVENRGHSGTPDSVFWEDNPDRQRLANTGQPDGTVSKDSIRTVDDFIRSLRPNAPMEWHSPIDISITTEPSALTAGPMTLNVKAKLNVPCDGVRIELVRDDNVKYQGQRKWTYEPEADDSIMLALPIVVPSEDTCGIQLRLFCGELRQWATVYFVSTALSVNRFDHDIRNSGHGANHKGKRKSIGIPDSVFWQEGKHQSAVRRVRSRVAVNHNCYQTYR